MFKVYSKDKSKVENKILDTVAGIETRGKFDYTIEVFYDEDIKYWTGLMKIKFHNKSSY